MNEIIDKIIENKKIVIGVFIAIFVVLILVIIFSSFSDKKKVEQKTWITTATPISKDKLLDGYSLENNGIIYDLPKYDAKDYYIDETCIGEKMYGNNIFIFNDQIIPILDLSNDSTKLIYKGESLPDSFKLMKVEFSDNVVAGLILDDNHIVKEILSDEFSEDIIGFKCAILTPDTAEFKENRIEIKNTDTTTKLSFTKGTLYKEIEVKNVAGFGNIVHTLLEDEYFKDIEVTKESYGYVKIGNKEKSLDTGYYILYNTDDFRDEEGKGLPKNRLLIKIKNSDSSSDSVNTQDARNQLEIIKKQISFIEIKKKLNLDGKISGKLLKGTNIYYPIFEKNEFKDKDGNKTDSNETKYRSSTKFANIDKISTTSVDYYFDIVGTATFNDKRYYYGTLVLTENNEAERKTSDINIEIAIDSDSYLKYLENSYEYIKLLKSENNDIKQINSVQHIKDFTGFKSITYDKNRNAIEKILE